MQFNRMKRREIIALLGGAAAWPIATRAQRPERTRRIGALMNLAANDPESPIRVAAFTQGLKELGWTVGANALIEYRWGAADVNRARNPAAELVALSPDVILATGSPAVAALQQATGTIPIVFVNVVDPVGAGFVSSLPQPGGNTTGFTLFEYGISAKWLEMLKQIAPRTARVGVFRDQAIASGIGQFAVIQAAAPLFGVELRPHGLRDAREIESAISAIAREENSAVIVTATGLGNLHRDLIVGLVARHQLPTIYFARSFVTVGGLISYGPDFLDGFRRAPRYVDRILRGETPAGLPVQAPTKYELVINLKTAKALGLSMPDKLLAIADEVIE
jgi:putative ABC transport system substrate-binding protein